MFELQAAENRKSNANATAFAQRADSVVLVLLAQEIHRTIGTLQARIRELERITGHSPAEILLHEPYGSNESSPAQSPITSGDFQEPPLDVKSGLVNTFLDRFTNSGYFFLEPLGFSDATLLPFPIGRLERPCPSLLGAVYLWGYVLSPASPGARHTAETFLVAALENLPADVRGFMIHPKLVLETIQAEVLLSLYYLHTALPVQGRYHAAAAASLALSARLHRLHAPPLQSHPSFALAEPLLPQVSNPVDAGERINAFWAVILINNCWVAAQGGPSAIPCGTAIDTPWPGGTRAGATTSQFLNGHDSDGYSSIAILSKASVLLERVVVIGARVSGLDATAFNALEQRLNAFQVALPPLSRDRTLLLAHALTDLSIIRLHAPQTRQSHAARLKALAAADRIAGFMESVTDGDPLLAPVCAAACAVYAHETASLRAAAPTPQYRQEIRHVAQRLESIMHAMALLAADSPVMRHCLGSIRAGHADSPRTR
ncbi:hypothetical protein GGX14DRAFT_593419 [Mycena pura]|uniref:Transcription factor domain-containing protein n=1 Tax=Mycena pura TaxID=153505 RepID=A0AAD6UUR7_9AGAR|nr:hypothetical protein GGX14DRAFT_593419 [Mycena pura]